MEWIFLKVQFSSVAQSCPTLCDPHELQHARPPCPSPTPGGHSNSRPLSRWCHPAISSSVVPFSSCPESLPASVRFGHYPISSHFTLIDVILRFFVNTYPLYSSIAVSIQRQNQRQLTIVPVSFEIRVSYELQIPEKVSKTGYKIFLFPFCKSAQRKRVLDCDMLP